jgi:D-alanyl-D-alanine carboxypeptidase (penicillin-binding protein 5/6)
MNRALRRVTLLLIAAVALASTAPITASSAIAPAPRSFALTTVDAQLTARAALAIDLTAGIELYAHNADTPLPPASTTKLLTVLVANRVLPRGEVVEILEQDLVPEEYSKMGLMAGDQVYVEALLYGALVASGGDAANVLARVTGARLDPEAADPVARFVQEMNAEAALLGMTSSRFVEPVGEDHPEQVTTARDLARAAGAILNDWLLAKIAATPWLAVEVAGPNRRELVLENTNQMVLYDGALGIKTGTTDLAGECLVVAINRGDHQLITVVLGSQDRYADTHSLLNAVDSVLSWVSVGAGAVSAGALDELAALGLWMPIRRTILMTPQQADALRYELRLSDDPDAYPWRGSVIFYTGEREIARLPVYGNE